MRDLYARYEADVAAARRALAAQPGQVGALIYMGSQWVGLEVLSGLFGRAWPRLCAGYVADAIGRKPESWQRLDAGAVLEALAQGRPRPRRRWARGRSTALARGPAAVTTLVAQGRVVHLMAFPGADAQQVNQ